TAAASLKHRHSQSFSIPDILALPRHHCRGLIEAFSPRSKPRSSAFLFRGLIEATNDSPVDVASNFLFRGITAAASLKLLFSSSGSSAATSSSAASLPRPH